SQKKQLSCAGHAGAWVPSPGSTSEGPRVPGFLAAYVRIACRSLSDHACRCGTCRDPRELGI
ncbi:hypothetical protein BGX38DRAFT_1228619, partial [Terfezia claveryi]